MTGTARFWLALNAAGRVAQFFTQQPHAGQCPGLHLVEYVCTPAADVARANDQLNVALMVAAGELPYGYSIRVEVERGAGWVEWIAPDNGHHIIDSEESSLVEDVITAMEAVTSAAQEAEDTEHQVLVLDERDVVDSEGGHHD